MAETTQEMREKFVTHRWLNGVMTAALSAMTGLCIFLAGFVVVRMDNHQADMSALVAEHSSGIGSELASFQARIESTQAMALNTAENTHMTALAGLSSRIENTSKSLSEEIARLDARQLWLLGELGEIFSGMVSERCVKLGDSWPGIASDPKEMSGSPTP